MITLSQTLPPSLPRYIIYGRPLKRMKWNDQRLRTMVIKTQNLPMIITIISAIQQYHFSSTYIDGIGLMKASRFYPKGTNIKDTSYV